ncbi:S8 family serine peptidase [candidate division KSB1 bacterium]
MKKTLAILCFVMLIYHSSLESQNPADKYWVFFKNKNAALLQKAAADESFRKTVVSERSLQRRRRIFGDDRMLMTDLPVAADYVRSIRELGTQPVVISRWLNAATFYLTPVQLENVKNLPFVLKVQPVKQLDNPTPVYAPELPGVRPAVKLAGGSAAQYGSSYTQNSLIRSIDLHNAGIIGKGIYVGVIDTGFDLSHDALDNVVILAERDFINDDSNTENETQSEINTGQDTHGTNVLSVLAAYEDSTMIGAAYGAQFAIAKTEYEPTETPVEEDYWVAAAEWMDSLGVDIITSSLGYSTFDNPADDYSTSDMDGNTAVITIAADIAAGKGIVVVNSAGNEATIPSWRIISAPADGDSVIAVGATYANGLIAGFSSRGPTADGRIKPDVVAFGVDVYCANSSEYVPYSYRDGTSFACPLVASVAALILSAHPELTPMDVRTALRQTADRAENPDNTYGWGFIDAVAAATYFGPVFSNTPGITVTNEGYEVSTNVLSERGLNEETIRLIYSVGLETTLHILAMVPADDSTRYKAVVPPQDQVVPIHFYFSAEDVIGQTTVFPNDSMGPVFTFTAGQTDIQHPGDRDRTKTRTVPASIILSENYPNPFNDETTIRLDLNRALPVRLDIYNQLGQRVNTLYDSGGMILPQGSYAFRWTGMNDNGRPMPSGIYFYRLTLPGYTKTRKMVLLK